MAELITKNQIDLENTLDPIYLPAAEYIIPVILTEGHNYIAVVIRPSGSIAAKLLMVGEPEHYDLSVHFSYLSAQ